MKRKKEREEEDDTLPLKKLPAVALFFSSFSSLLHLHRLLLLPRATRKTSPTVLPPGPELPQFRGGFVLRGIASPRGSGDAPGCGKKMKLAHLLPFPLLPSKHSETLFSATGTRTTTTTATPGTRTPTTTTETNGTT